MEIRRKETELESRDATSPPARRTLVLGIGNVLMGDEGVGCAAVRLLAEMPRDAGVSVLDGGTGGFHLLGHLDGVDRLVLVDAADDGHPPGTVGVTRPRFLSDFPRALSAHEIGLRDLLETATLLGRLPPTDLVTISIATPLVVGTELSQKVASALPTVVAAVLQLLAAEPRMEASPALGN
jgi:hydrogenase maturation protease